MKGTALFLLCVIAISYADLEGFYNNGCPRDTSIDKLLPHENCDQFYQCFHGALIARFCPSGLFFNADLEKCDWHGDPVKCSNKREDDNKSSDSFEELDSNNPSHAVLICSTPDSNGVLIAHENCNEFYKCSYGKPVALKCARDLLYNPVNEKCDWPHNVDCSERVVAVNESYTTLKRNNKDAGYSAQEIDNSNSDPNQANTLCASRRSDGILVAHEHCNKYYKCAGGKPVTMNCPANLLYNPTKEHCDWARNVDCSERISTENDVTNINAANDEKNDDNDENENSISEEDNAAIVCASDNSEGVLVAHEKCNKFYKCISNHPVPFNCPGILLFNQNKNYCDWAKNVDCSDRITPDGIDSANDNDNNTPGGESGGNSNDPSQAYALCSTQGSDGVLITHERCDQFYKCHDGRAVELKCPGNLLYNPSKEYCDWPTYVDCGDRTVPESNDGNENNIESGSGSGSGSVNNNGGEPSEAAVICAGENSDGALIAHENCNQFYKCFEGKPVALFCQLNLYYNPRKEYCDWPHNVNCGNRIIPGDSNNSEDDSNNLNTSCSGNLDGNIVPHENCSQFYKCVNGQTYPMDCPPGLYFNALLKVCDWPMNVDCGERLTESQAHNKHGVVRRALGVAVLP